MNIAIDLTALQSPHRMRGIGYTIINFINNVSLNERTNNKWIFYSFKDSEYQATDLLDLNNFNYELRFIEKNKEYADGKILNRLKNLISSELRIIFGDNRIKKFHGVDVFIQPDQNRPLPPRRKVRSILFLYDIIPYAMKEDYLWDYKTARINGKSRKGAIRHSILRMQYARSQKANCKRSKKLIAISNKTKKDFVKYFNVKNDKILVIHLGVNKEILNNCNHVDIFRQELTCWGYRKKLINLQNKDYLLFVGGADSRRKLKELIAAYNNYKARGVDISLVLAGDSLFSAKDIPNIEINKYLENTSYKEDIYFLGFISDDERDWLYKHAIAFVYPSLYEGFGLPILEAMEHGCPVITYKNMAVYEVAKDAALYAEPANYLGIMKKVDFLKNGPRKNIIKNGKYKADEYSWIKTSAKIYSVAKNIGGAK